MTANKHFWTIIIFGWVGIFLMIYGSEDLINKGCEFAGNPIWIGTIFAMIAFFGFGRWYETERERRKDDSG